MNQSRSRGQRCLALFVGVSLLVSSLVVGNSAHAGASTPEAEAARKQFEVGSRAFALGDFTKAIEAYKAGFNLKPDPVFLYNIGQSYRLSGDLKQALFFYQSYLSNSPRAPNRKEVEDRIVKLEAQIAEQKATPVAPATVRATPPPANPDSQVTATPVAVMAQAAPVAKKKPGYKQWWLWTAVGAVVVIGVGVGLGVGLQPKPPSSTLGATEVF